MADWNAERWDSNNDGEPDSDFEEHQLAYPTYHNPVVPARYLTSSPDEVDNFSITETPRMYYNANAPETGAFECFFKVTAPDDVQWKPGITGTKENYKVRVYNHTAGPGAADKLLFDSSDKELQSNLGACASDGWYRIVVFPLSGDGAGKNEVDFIISYYQSWTDQYIHLYINGEYDHIRWPDSGNNPKIITIKDVAQEMKVIEE